MTSARPLSAKAVKGITYRVALCGAGPTGLTALKHLHTLWQDKAVKGRLHVDVFDASLVPTGLIRSGVAPDHRAIKEIGASLIQQIQNFKEEDEENMPGRFTFEYFGGVEVGKWVTLRSIRHAYDSVLMATGIPLSANKNKPSLGLAREWNPGVVTSKEIVNLYNGPPLACPAYLYELYERVPGVMAEAGQWTVDSKLLDYSLARSYSVTSQDGSKLSRRELTGFGKLFEPDRTESNIVIIGQGNVSVDVTRVLLTKPSDLPRKQVPKASFGLLRSLHDGPPPDVHICGRRGALQSAWDTATLRELFHMGGGVKVMVRGDELQASIQNPVVAKELRKNRTTQRMLALLEEGVLNAKNDEVSRTPTSRVWLRYLLSPTKLGVNTSESRWKGTVNSVEFSRNMLKLPPAGKQLRDLIAIPDERVMQRETIEDVCLVVKSMGFGRSGQANLSPWKYFDPSPPPLTNNKNFAELPRAWKKPAIKPGTAAKTAIMPRDETSAPVFAAGWLRTGGLGNLGDSMEDAKMVSNELMTEMLATAKSRDYGESLLADLLCLRATVPEIGIPIDWEEAMQVLDCEASSGEKLSEWKKAADIVNDMRELRGPRSEKWQANISRLKPQCLSHAH